MRRTYQDDLDQAKHAALDAALAGDASEASSDPSDDPASVAAAASNVEDPETEPEAKQDTELHRQLFGDDGSEDGSDDGMDFPPLPPGPVAPAPSAANQPVEHEAEQDLAVSDEELLRDLDRPQMQGAHKLKALEPLKLGDIVAINYIPDDPDDTRTWCLGVLVEWDKNQQECAKIHYLDNPKGDNAANLHWLFTDPTSDERCFIGWRNTQARPSYKPYTSRHDKDCIFWWGPRKNFQVQKKSRSKFPLIKVNKRSIKTIKQTIKYHQQNAADEVLHARKRQRRE